MAIDNCGLSDGIGIGYASGYRPLAFVDGDWPIACILFELCAW